MRAQPAKPKPFVLPDHVVWARPGLVAWANSNGISTTRVDIRSDVVECRAVFLIKDVVGNVVDATGRSMINSKPKWKRYGDSPVPYTHGSGPTTVVVEDAISAAVVGEYIDGATGVALLGTSLTPYIKEYLKQRSNVIIALDPDARKKALKMKRELSGYTNVHVVSLLDDIKYRRANDMFVISKLCNPN
jgi:hypothetical protein